MVARATVVPSDRPRPRIDIEPVDRAAHEARLAKLRGKAGKAVWDVVAEPEAALA